MQIVKKIRQQIKNTEGRSLFAIDLVISQDNYVWDGSNYSSFFLIPGEGKPNDPMCLDDDVYNMLSCSVKLIMLINIAPGHAGVRKKIDEIESFAVKNVEDEELLRGKLNELGKVVNDIPLINKIYLPDFALNSNGDYCEEFMRKDLLGKENFEEESSSDMLEIYMDHILNDFQSTVILFNEKKNAWLFNFVDFMLGFVSESFSTKKLSMQEVVELVDDETIDEIIDGTDISGYFMSYEQSFSDDDELVIAHLNENQKAIFYLLIE